MATPRKTHWLEPPTWWKTWRPLRWLAVLTILGSLISTTWTIQANLPPEQHPDTSAYTAVETTRVALADFQSYDTVENVQATLTAGGYKFTQTRLYSTPSASYPDHKMDTLTVEGYSNLGAKGGLTLEFFNNRLYEVDFAPRDATVYAPALHRALPLLTHNQSGETEWINGNLRVASNVDLAANAVGQSLGASPYVIWQDLRLIRQRDEWDKKFSAVPAEPRKGFWFW